MIGPSRRSMDQARKLGPADRSMIHHGERIPHSDASEIVNKYSDEKLALHIANIVIILFCPDEFSLFPPLTL